jgi:hypothetical protein
VRFVSLPAFRPIVDFDRVRQALGGSLAIPEELEAGSQQLIDQVVQVSQPRGRMAVATIQRKAAESIHLETAITLHGVGITALLRRCDQVAGFIITLGPGPEKLIQEATKRGRLADLTIIDAIASEAIETLAAQAQEFITQRMAQEHRATTVRFSPGYCDWNLTQQQQLDAFVHFEDVGVQLSPDCIMVPEKSISAVIGVGPEGSLGRKLAAHPVCAGCPKRDGCPGPPQD